MNKMILIVFLVLAALMSFTVFQSGRGIPVGSRVCALKGEWGGYCGIVRNYNPITRKYKVNMYIDSDLVVETSLTKQDIVTEEEYN